MNTLGPLCTYENLYSGKPFFMCIFILSLRLVYIFEICIKFCVCWYPYTPHCEIFVFTSIYCMALKITTSALEASGLKNICYLLFHIFWPYSFWKCTKKTKIGSPYYGVFTFGWGFPLRWYAHDNATPIYIFFSIQLHPPPPTLINRNLRKIEQTWSV
jgi:hypothetical protein